MRAGVIGTGVMGRNHARIYAEMDGVELAGIADPNIRVGMEIAGKYKCRYYRSHRELLKNEKLDVVSVCVPTALHFGVAKDVIGSGVSLLVEKPIAGKMNEGKEMVRLARKAGVKLAVGHIERFNPAVQSLKKLIDDGKLGKITSILARRVGLFPPRIKDANVVIDLAVHDIDIFSYLLGKEPKSICAAGGKALAKDREDYADIFLKYNGTNGFIEVNWITPVKVRVLNVTGTKGYARLNYVTQKLTVFESNYEKSFDAFGDFVVRFGEPQMKSLKVKNEEPLKLELADFIESVRKDRPPLVSGEDGLQALGIAMDVMKSMGG
jgi:UDP-N-acetylglucosamine 3-dehydrogenase